MKKKLNFLSFYIVFASFLFVTPSVAIEKDYKNNLLNVDVTKSQEGSLNLSIYTDTTYKEPLKVIPKTENQYVLLLPETSSSVNTAGIVKDLKNKTGGIVKNVELKHYPYPNAGLNNGYTKVTVTTSQPVSISAKAYSTGFAAQKTIPAKPSSEKIKNNVTKVAADTTKQTPTTTKKTNNKVVSKVAAQEKNIAKKKVVKAQPIVNKQNVLEKPLKTKEKQVEVVENSETQTDTLSNTTDENVEQLDTELMPTIDYETVVDDNLTQKKSSKKENILLIILLLVLTPLTIIALKLNNQKDENIIKRPKIPKKIKKHFVNPSNKQVALINLMDSQNLSWQERYNLMKKQELSGSDSELTKNSQCKMQTEFSSKKIEDFEKKFQPELSVNSFSEADIAEKVKYYNKLSEQFKNEHQQKELSQKQKFNDKSEKFKKMPKVQGNIASFNSWVNDDTDNENEKNEVSPYIYIEKTNEPTLIKKTEIATNKGFYLTAYKNETALLGYINENVFLLKKFQNENITSINVRLNEKQNDGNIYMVKTGNYKALVKVSDLEISLVIEL